jgi:hypothetical protein
MKPAQAFRSVFLSDLYLSFFLWPYFVIGSFLWKTVTSVKKIIQVKSVAWKMQIAFLMSQLEFFSLFTFFEILVD